MAPTRTPILLVDDQRSNLLALASVLDRPEYEFVGVTSGPDALAELERRDFAVILLDVQMPTMDGIETATKMRDVATRLGRQAPIIFVTAIDADRERVLSAYASGAVDLMQKPLEPAVIAAKVGVFAALYRARRLARERGVELEAERRGAEHLAAEKAALVAKAAAEEAQRIQREFLVRAGETLGSSLDYRTTLASVARLAVPELADWCSVELRESEAEGPVQVAVEHVDPEKVRYAKELANRYPPDPNSPTGVPEVIRSGKPLLYAEIPAGLVEAGARDAEHLRLLRELRLESAMVVPLIGRERVLGAMTFIYAGSGRRYGENDLAFVADFARRAAMAIENGQAHTKLNATLEFQERFVAVLGHDLRNPLSAIDMAAAVLRKRTASEPAITRVVDRIRASSLRMSRMIEQILDLSRSRLGGGLEVKPTPVDLSETLSSIVAELGTAHPSRVVDLRAPATLPGTWDRDRLEQVFSNLVANAISYGLEDRPITVEARPLDEGRVEVTVHNEGEPIPPDLQAQLFNPFRRGTRDSREARTAGLGLGLFICRELVRAHGGELALRSNAAQGTTFRVVLPRAAQVPARQSRGGSP